MTSKMKHLLKKILTPIIERRLVLPLLAFAAGLPSLPALAQEAAQVTARRGGPDRTATRGLHRKERRGERGKDQLQDRRAGAGGRPAPRLHPNKPYVAAADAAAREKPHGDRPRFARRR